VKTTFELKGFKVVLTQYWNCYVHEHRYFFVLRGSGHKHISKDFCTAQRANKAALEIAEALMGDDLQILRERAFPTGVARARRIALPKPLA
jgi:hypothetical protein